MPRSRTASGSEHRNEPGPIGSPITRRSFVAGLGGVAAGAALGLPYPTRALAQDAAVKGQSSRAATYKLDLGGYAGPELTSQPITLKFLRQEYLPKVNDTLEETLKEFNEAYPNIKIEVEKVPYGDKNKKIQIYLASGQAPDVMMGRTDFTEAYHFGKVALPLQDYFLDEYLADIIPGNLAASSSHGNFYCAPWSTYFTLMYFNKDLFRKAKVPLMPEVDDVAAGWDFEQFLGTMEEFTKNLRAQGDAATWAVASATAGNGGPGANYSQLESLWIRAQGDPNAAPDSSAYKTFVGVSEDGLDVSGYIDTPEAVEGARNYQRLFTSKLSPPNAVRNQFYTSEAAVYYSAKQIADRLLDNNVDFEWGVSPMLHGRSTFNCNACDGPIVWSKTPYPAEAAAFVAFLCNDANRIKLHIAEGDVPVRKSLFASIPPRFSPQIMKLIESSATVAVGAPKTPGAFEYSNEMNVVMRNIALGGDPAQSLKGAATKINGLLRKYR